MATESKEAFLQKVVESGVIPMPHLKLVWEVMEAEAVDWVAREKKSLDLGFCVIHPNPYRASWKAQLYRACDTLSQMIRGRNALEREYFITKAGITDKLRDTGMLAFNLRHRTIYWSLEVEPKAAWHRAIIKHEREQYTLLGPSGYFRNIAAHVHRLKARLLRSYLAWLSTLAKPMAAPSPFTRGRGAYLTPRIPRGKRLPESPEYLPEPDYDFADPAQLAFTGDPKALEAENESMSEVPDIQPEAEDVRDAGGPQ